ncbi:MAG: ABC transporter ATP-binding protein [Kiritimatiellia bacterium]|jgi:ABC-2 type transport system ATP-binding protein
MLELRHLTRRFGAFAAVDDLSLSVAPGEIVGLLGRNGAGKSTLLRMAAGTLAPTGGEVLVGGRDLYEGSPRRRAATGFLPERAPLPPDPTVEEFLLYRSTLYGQGGRRAKVRARDAIARCGLERERHVRIGLLSQGQRIRCGIATAIVHSPKVLLLDEPLAEIDPFQLRSIAALIRGLSAKAAILLATHQLPEASRLCTRFAALRAGRLVAACGAEQIPPLPPDAAGRELRLEVRSPDGSDTPPAIGHPGLERFQAHHLPDGWWRLAFTVAPPAPADPREPIVEAVRRAGWRLRAIDFVESPLAAWLAAADGADKSDSSDRSDRSDPSDPSDLSDPSDPSDLSDSSDSSDSSDLSDSSDSSDSPAVPGGTAP